MNNIHRLRPRSEMGSVEAAAAIASALGSKGGSSGGSGGGGGGVSVPTTVSPTFQQSFTPQFSPNLIQSSGSGAVTATSSQVAPGGQTAQGGSQSAPPMGASQVPHVPTVPSVPSITPSYQDFDARRYAIPGQDAASVIREQNRTDWGRYILPAGLTVAALLAVIGYNRRNKKGG